MNLIKDSIKSLFGSPNTTYPETVLIIGLGNPGNSFANTRHNLGFVCVDHISRLWNIPLKRRNPNALVGIAHMDEKQIILAKPRTYVNQSGKAVQYLVNRFSIETNAIFVIYDDMNLDLGKLRIRPGGSSGGHNGIKSIISLLKSDQFPRLRIGIGPPIANIDPIEHVLGAFINDEKAIIENAVSKSVEVIEHYLRYGLVLTMNKFN